MADMADMAQERMDRVMKKIRTLTLDNLIFIVMKSNNDNSIGYFYENGEILAKWILLEEGEKELIKSLDFAENLLYGANVETIENDRLMVRINGDMEKKMCMELVLDSTNQPCLITSISNQRARANWAYANIGGKIPTLESLILYGTNFSGKSVQQECK